MKAINLLVQALYDALLNKPAKRIQMWTLSCFPPRNEPFLLYDIRCLYASLPCMSCQSSDAVSVRPM
jgi:hypothetical protein